MLPKMAISYNQKILEMQGQGHYPNHKALDTLFVQKT